MTDDAISAEPVGDSVQRQPKVKRQTMYVLGGVTFLLSALSNGSYWLHVEGAPAWCHIACDHGRWHHLGDFKRSREAQAEMRRLVDQEVRS